MVSSPALPFLLLLLLLYSNPATAATTTTTTTPNIYECHETACDRQVFTCDPDESCLVKCSGFKSCANLRVVGGVGSEVQVECSDSLSCIGLELDCEDAASCTATCSGFKSCHAANATCSTTSEQDCGITCTGTFSCERRGARCDLCRCIDDCAAVQTDVTITGLFVRSNILNELSLVGFDVDNVLSSPDFIQFYFPRLDQIVDINDDINVSWFMYGVSYALGLQTPDNPELEWIHPHVLRYNMPPAYIAELLKINFLGEVAGLPIVVLPASYTSERIILQLEFANDVNPDAWATLEPALTAQLSGFYSTFFNVAPQHIITLAELEGKIASFTSTLPSVANCSLPQPFYGVICVSSDPPRWESANVNQLIFFPDFFTGSTPTQADGNVLIEFGVSIVEGTLLVSRNLEVSEGKVDLSDSSLQTGGLDLIGSGLTSTHSDVVINGNFSIDHTSSVSFDETDSTPIVVHGCAIFDGELHLSLANSTEGRSVPVVEFDCHEGEYSSVIIDDSEDDCMFAIPEYRETAVFVDIFRNCEAALSSAPALPPLSFSSLQYFCSMFVALSISVVCYL